MNRDNLTLLISTAVVLIIGVGIIYTGMSLIYHAKDSTCKIE